MKNKSTVKIINKNAFFEESKLDETLTLLSKDELKSFKKWLDSPWCNANKKLRDFYRLLEDNRYRKNKLSKEAIYEALFKKKGYDNKTMNNLIWELVRQLEKFLSINDFLSSPTSASYHLCQSYLKRKKLDWFKKKAESSISSIDQKIVKDWEDYLHLGIMNEKVYFQPNQDVRYQPNPDSLIAMEKNLDLFYALGKFRILHEYASRKELLKYELRKDPAFEHLTYLKNRLNHPAIDLYHHRLCRSKDWTPKEFLAFKEMALANFSSLPELEKKVFLLSSINDAVVMVSKGFSELQKDMLELYKLGLKTKLLLHNGFITVTTFNNIVLVASNIREANFARSFVYEHIKHLPEDVRQEARIWAEGQILYSTGKYNECLDLMSPFTFKHALYAIASRVTLLKANFDAVMADETRKNYFISTCDNFDNYIRRNDLFGPERSKAYLRLAQHAKKLMSIKLGKKEGFSASLKMLKSKIEKEGNIFGKQWLLSKIEEIEEEG